MAFFPKQVAIFNAEWLNIGEFDETLKVTWIYPGTQSGNRQFIVGTDVFLESPINMSQVPDAHLIASVSMASILAGHILPGTQEYIDVVTSQGTKYFQTIIGNATLKTVVPVIDSSVGPLGTVYDLTFNKVGSGNNVKTVRIDAWTLSQYDNRVDSAAHSVECVPGALHKQFAFKKSDLGPADSDNRNSVVSFIQSNLFWI